MDILPVLKLTQFDFKDNKGDYYANIFSNHLSTYHASITKPHKHDFYLIVLFTQGNGTHEIDFNTYSITPGALFILKPGQTHNWKLSTDIEGYIFFHSPNFYRFLFPNKTLIDYPIFQSNATSPLIQLDQKELELYTEKFKQIYSEYKSNEWLMYRKFGLMVDNLYIDFSRKVLENTLESKLKKGKALGQVQQLEQLIDLHYKVNKRALFYAGELNITVKHLNKITKRTLNKTTSDLIHERIILEAKRLLSHGETSIQEIAFELGFENVSYFSRFFKKKTNFAPRNFSKE